MRNVFLFIRRYFNLVIFLALQVIALWILFRFNKFHESVFSSVANEFTGKVNNRFNSIETYFTLKKRKRRAAGTECPFTQSIKSRLLRSRFFN